MDKKFAQLSQKIAALAQTLPPGLVDAVQISLLLWDDANWSLSQAKALANIHQPQVKADLFDLFAFWRKELPDLPGSALALALQSASAEHARSQQTHLDLVWTGPKAQGAPMRRTDQALLELIAAAQEKLLIVSFAVYKIDAISAALAAALQRGVEVKIILESPTESAGKISFSGAQSLGGSVLAGAKLYVWPLEKRPFSEDGKHGSLHAKVAVADSTHLFISSANLTEYAMEMNMEMGLLITGGELPAQIRQHFDEFMAQGILKQVR